MRRLLSRIIACVVLAFTVGTCLAADSPWTHKRFVYRADGKRLSEVFQDFAASQGLPVVVDASVEGTVNGQFNAKPEQFLDATAKTYGLVWYFDGVTLFIYPSRTMASRVYRMRGYTSEQVRQMLQSLGLGDARFPLRFNEAEQTLLAYGPPRHLELVQTVIDALDGSARDQVGKSIKVFQLKHAAASDVVSGGTRIPGLASVLNKVFSGRDGQNFGDELKQQVNDAAERAEKLRSAALNFSLLGAGDKASKDGVRDAGGRQLAPESQTAEVDRERPYFQAEESTNSIIVRGTPERMPQYEALIRQLDVPQDMVEIEASIIDVNTDAFDSLGISWDFTRNGNRVTVSPGTYSSDGLNESMVGNNITTVVGDAGRQLLSRIRALEGGGKARVVARPKVLGADNRQATMVDKRVASVRVAGNLDANLFTIEAGTTVQVVPHIVNLSDRRDLRLTLYIEDGSFEGAVVDSVPIIKRTQIRTEATIREGESLLVGGISVESDSHGRSGLPGLSRIPLLGALFRHDEVKTFRSERLFLITPKIVALDRAVPVAVPAAPPEQGVAAPAQAASQAGALSGPQSASGPVPPAPAPSTSAPAAPAPAETAPAAGRLPQHPAAPASAVGG
jgi:type III secretion protein C